MYRHTYVCVYGAECVFSWHCKTQTQNFHSGRAPRVDFSQPLGATSPTSAPLHPLSAPIHTHTQRHTHTHTHPDMGTERSLLAYLLLPLPNPFCVLSPQKFNEVTRRQCQFLSLSRQKSSASQHPKHPRHRAARRHPSCVQPSCHRLQMAASFFMLAQLRIQFRSVRWWRAAAFVHFALNIHRDPKRTKLLFCFGFCRQISRDFFVSVCVCACIYFAHWRRGNPRICRLSSPQTSPPDPAERSVRICGFNSVCRMCPCMPLCVCVCGVPAYRLCCWPPL